MPERDERAMPEDREASRLHRRIVEAIAKRMTARHVVHRALEHGGVSGGPMQHGMEMRRPDLRIARERFAVKTDVVGLRAEENFVDLVLAGECRGIVLAMHALPTMRAAIGRLRFA